MRILSIHSDYIEIEPKEKAIAQAEEIEKVKKRIEDCLVVFVSVEEEDEKGIEKQAFKEIKNIAEQVKAEKIVLYPFVHLSSTPASPEKALKILKALEEETKKEFNVYRAPFGWYKAFEIRCKGHALAELSREIKKVEKEEEEVPEALKQEEKVKSEWYILTPEGELIEAEKFDFSEHRNLEKFFRYEYAKARAVDRIPPHVKLMREMHIADYEEGSDLGNMKYYPKGRLIKSLLEEFVTREVIKFGAMEIETPIMYSADHPALESYLNRFPARQYFVESGDRKLFLRFAACFGQFLMSSKMTISYKHLPLRLYELTRYSFRREKSGELVGLRRLRAFTMPDMHTMCENMEQAKKEFAEQFRFCTRILEKIGFSKHDYETAIRFTKDFWKENKEFIKSLVKEFGKPVLIEMWNFRYAYFDPKFEFNFIDALDKASALSTVQIDHENAKRFGITYVDSEDKKRHPLILHCSPSGAIERCIYALLEKAWMEKEKGKVPELPLWLTPVQVRLCPINDSFVEYCEEIADYLEKYGIRVDIDDRGESVQRKIRDAETEWIPYIVVIGEKEKESGKLSVRIRKEKVVKELSKDELRDLIINLIKDYPSKPLPLPRKLSQRTFF